MGRDDFFQKRKSNRAESKDASSECFDEYLASNCPILFAFLCQRRVNGVRRKLGSITLFADENRLKFCLSDKDNSDVGFGTLSSAETVWSDVEAMLDNDTVEWRPQGGRRS